MPEPLEFIEHQVITSEKYSNLAAFDDVEFIGPPQSRKDMPKYLGISRENGQLKASYYVGTTWIKENEVFARVSPKIEGLNFGQMFSTALKISSKGEADYFGNCYGISSDSSRIPAKNELADDFLILIIYHYVYMLKKIVSNGLRHDYIDVEENLKSKIKGKILVPRNITENNIRQRFDRTYCLYQIFTENIPENRLLKKALLMSERLASDIKSLSNDQDLRRDIQKLKNAFTLVSSDIDICSVRQVKYSKIYRHYDNAIRTAKMILKQESFDTGNGCKLMPPFWIDMTGLFELYIYYLLTDAYGTYNIVFQAQGRHETRADYVDVESGLIIDAKYKTWYSFSDNQKGNPIEDIRQLSGYARDLKIIKQMNVSDPEKYIPPCIIIYPNSDGCENFQGKTLKELSDKNSSNNPLSHFVNFYKVGVKLPTLK